MISTKRGLILPTGRMDGYFLPDIINSPPSQMHDTQQGRGTSCVPQTARHRWMWALNVRPRGSQLGKPLRSFWIVGTQTACSPEGFCEGNPHTVWELGSKTFSLFPLWCEGIAERPPGETVWRVLWAQVLPHQILSCVVLVPRTLPLGILFCLICCGVQGVFHRMFSGYNTCRRCPTNATCLNGLELYLDGSNALEHLKTAAHKAAPSILRACFESSVVPSVAPPEFVISYLTGLSPLLDRAS